MPSNTATSDFSVRIRIVDDQASVRESLAFMLRQEGFECVCYESARDFLIDDMPSIPGCLLLDVQMPEMSGLELQQELIRRGSTLPIVFLSAYGTIDMAVDTMQKGADPGSAHRTLADTDPARKRSRHAHCSRTFKPRRRRTLRRHFH